jgi:glycosyltransferase involved in cell wall biosynthesis
MTEWMHPKLNRPVRITYVGDAANPHTRKWVEHFVSLGCDIRIVSYRAAEYETVKVHVHGVEKHSKMPVIRQLQTLADYAQVKAELNWPDIVHVHFIYRHRFNMLFAGMKRLVVSTWGTDVVQDEHTLEGGKYDYWRSFLLNRATVITATSGFLAEKTRRFLSDQSREIRVIPFGVDIDFFRRKTERPTDPKPLVISFIKHLRKKYGPDVFIRALSKVKSGFSNIKLIMAGKGEMEDELKGLAMELGLADIIEFPGWVDIEGVRDILERSDIFVQPGGHQPEAFGVAAVEAQAMEVPVIASKTGGVPEAVKDGESGILIEPADVDILAEAMDRLIGDAGLRRDMGIAGRKWVEEKFDWRQNARMMEDVYHEVLGW